jgi:hypothetical protein
MELGDLLFRSARLRGLASIQGMKEGLPLEDLGVRSDVRHQHTLRDVCENNVDLYDRAGEILKKLESSPRSRLR